MCEWISDNLVLISCVADAYTQSIGKITVSNMPKKQLNVRVWLWKGYFEMAEDALQMGVAFGPQ